MTEAEIKALGYAFARQLPDGRWLGVQQMLFTAGLFVDLDPVGYACRYCYETVAEAILDAQRWDGVGDPPGAWIVRKGRDGDFHNPNWPRSA
jgi:hypothetical protein